MIDDYEESDNACPKCGETLAYRRCSALGCEDGTIDDDDDPLWPESVTCDTCCGVGYEEWCRCCGWDNVAKHFLSPQYEAEWKAKQEANQ